MFTTQTGRTGREAYIQELAQIQGQLKMLRWRLDDLKQFIITEVPEDATGTVSVTLSGGRTLYHDLNIRMVAETTSLDSMNRLMEMLTNYQEREAK